jgi:hypothetical protein
MRAKSISRKEKIEISFHTFFFLYLVAPKPLVITNKDRAQTEAENSRLIIISCGTTFTAISQLIITLCEDCVLVRRELFFSVVFLYYCGMVLFLLLYFLSAAFTLLPSFFDDVYYGGEQQRTQQTAESLCLSSSPKSNSIDRRIKERKEYKSTNKQSRAAQTALRERQSLCVSAAVQKASYQYRPEIQ